SEESKEGGLPGAIRSKEGQTLRRLQLECHLAHRTSAGERACEPLRLENRWHLRVRRRRTLSRLSAEWHAQRYRLDRGAALAAYGLAVPHFGPQYAWTVSLVSIADPLALSRRVRHRRPSQGKPKVPPEPGVSSRG